MMGEIRDEESADALMRLSSSGHRAISTLHTNSVCGDCWWSSRSHISALSCDVDEEDRQGSV